MSDPKNTTTPAPAKNTAVFTPGNTPGTPPAVPGAGQPSTPGGTPWVPNGTPTGVEAPGFFGIFFDLVKAYVANGHLSSQGIVDDQILDLAANLARRIQARYPQGRVDQNGTPPGAK
jgi:hypothetical protein